MTIAISHEFHGPAGSLYVRSARSGQALRRLGDVSGWRARSPAHSVRVEAPLVLVNGCPVAAPITFSSMAYSAALGAMVGTTVTVTP